MSRTICTAIAVTLSALTMQPALADSHAGSGMGRGNGPCFALASPNERALMKHESRGWPRARNPRSSAFGCGQLLIGQRRRFAAACHTIAETIEPGASMCLLRSYVASRYRTTERALAHRRAAGWY